MMPPRHRRRRVRLVSAARARETDTIPMTATAGEPPTRAVARSAAGDAPPSADPAALRPLRRCSGGCRRLIPLGFRYCCWVCMAAEDGGWTLRAWSPGQHWTTTHSRACELRHAWYGDRSPDVTSKRWPGYHECPARVCQRQVADRLLMCGQHWHMVPAPLQRAVYAAYRLGPIGSIDLMRAQHAAITAVNAHYPQEG
jgi:hypothetical protein